MVRYMTIEEIIEKNFSSSFYDSNNFEDIYNFVESCESKLTLKKLGIETSNIVSYVKGEKTPQYTVKCENDTVTSFVFEVDNCVNILFNIFELLYCIELCFSTFK